MHHEIARYIAIFGALTLLALGLLTPFFSPERLRQKVLCTAVYIFLGLAFLAMGLYG